MPSALTTTEGFVAAGGWLLLATAVAILVLGYGAFRYRRRYLHAADELQNSRDLIENLSEGIYRSSPDGRQLSANAALVRLNGYSTEAEMLHGVKDIAKEWYVDPHRRDEFRNILRRTGRVDNFISEVYRHKTRERIWITEAARMVRHKKTGRVLFYEGSVREITETVKRLTLEEQVRKLTAQLPGGLFQFSRHSDGTSRVLYVSDGCRRITGLPEMDQATLPAAFMKMIHEDDREGYTRSVAESAESMEAWNYEFRMKTADGEEKWVRISARPEKTDDAIIWHGYFSDISVRKKQEMEIEELAYYDVLTTLPNRRLFQKRMVQAVTNCAEQGECGAVLFIDLDNFKALNDTQGHDTGDAFLVQVAQRLQGCVGEHEMVARLGGDEFVIVSEAAGRDRARAVRHGVSLAGRVLSEMRRSFDIGPRRHLASASIGVVVFDQTDTRIDDILRHADLAMYQAKAAGRNGMALFDPACLDGEAERYRLVNDLRAALDAEALHLYFQLQVNDNRMVVGAEALVRWDHPELGFISPDRFVPLAEQCGMTDELTRFVCTRGMETLAAWQRDPSKAHLQLAINVSVQSFANDSMANLLKDLIGRHGVDASRLTIEITERVMAQDQDVLAARMTQLKALGIQMALDDFGTGYSSLGYLKGLPFDEVKIDGSFVRDIETSESDRALIKTILAMARTLNLRTVAEHVEDVKQEAFLRALGCDWLQGYLYGRPMPLERLFDASAQEQPARQRASA